LTFECWGDRWVVPYSAVRDLRGPAEGVAGAEPSNFEASCDVNGELEQKLRERKGEREEQLKGFCAAELDCLRKQKRVNESLDEPPA